MDGGRATVAASTAETLLTMQEKTMMMPAKIETDGDSSLADATRFIQDAAITRDMIDQVLNELVLPNDPADEMPRLVAWLVEYLWSGKAENVGDRARALSWRYMRWRCAQNVDAVEGKPPGQRDGPRIRMVDPRMLKIDPELRDLVPRPMTRDLVALRESIHRERRVRDAIKVRASDMVIIDGHTRHEEALRCGLLEVPIVEEFVPHVTETWKLVASCATTRRHLSDWQRVRLAARVLPLEQAEAKLRMAAGRKQGHGVDACPPAEDEAGKTRDNIARKVGLGSGRQLDRGLRLLEHAPKAILVKLDSEELTIGAAYRLVFTDPEIRASVHASWRQTLQSCATRVRPALNMLLAHQANSQDDTVAASATRAALLLQEFLALADSLCDVTSKNTNKELEEVR